MLYSRMTAALWAYVLFLIALVMVTATGWVYNLVWLLKGTESTEVEFWISVIGAFIAPIGVIAGWVHIL